MKKLIAGAVLVLLLIGLIIYYFATCVGVKSTAGWEVTDGVDYMNISHKYAYVYRYNGTDKDVVLGDIYYNQSVISIDESAFASTEAGLAIESIKIPASVEEIEDSAFENCTKLKRVEFEEGSNLKIIGRNVFKNCTSLEEIVIPKNLEKIGASTFLNCSSLKKIALPDTVTELKEELFSGCTKLAEIDLPKNLTSIGASLLTGSAYYEKAANWSNDVLYLDNYLIEARPSVADTYQVKANTKAIASKAFNGNATLVKVELPASLVAISANAFVDCFRLVEVYNKSNIVIQPGATDKENATNSGNLCLYALNVYDDANETKLSTDAQGFLVYTDGAEKTVIDYYGSAIVVALPAGTTAVNRSAFRDSAITEIEIPATVKSFGEGAFEGCAVKVVNYLGSESDWASINFANEKANPIYYAKGLKVNGADLIDAVISAEKVSASAFYNCETLKKVTFTADVKNVDKNAFKNCKNIGYANYTGTIDQWASIIFGNSDANPVANAHNLYINDVLQTEITLSVEQVARCAFYACYSLNKVTFESTVKEINAFAFTDCYKLVEVCDKSNMGINLKSEEGDIAEHLIGVCKTDAASKLSTDANGYVIYTDGDQKILVAYNGSETALTLPEVTKINAYAFKGNTNIVSIVLPETLEEIGAEAFAECELLTSIVIPESVTTIATGAFTYTETLYIYCEAESKPSKWNRKWIDDDANVLWAEDWEMVGDVPTAKDAE